MNECETAAEAYTGKPPRYFYRIAYTYGIPEIWRDDYCQEVTVKAWRFPEMKVSIIARQIAIDFVRRLKERHAPAIDLNAFPYQRDEFEIREKVLDANRLLGQLTPGEIRGVAAYLRGGLSNLEKVEVYKARKRLRSLQELEAVRSVFA